MKNSRLYKTISTNHGANLKPVLVYILPVIAIILTLSSLTSCKKLIDIKPSTTAQLGSEVYTDSASVQAVISGMYGKLSVLSTTQSYRSSISTLSGFSADELNYVGSSYDQFINNAIPVTDTNVGDIWSNSYSTIYVANSLIEGVTQSSSISVQFKNQAIAEAEFIRSFCYFYLANLYGDVPLVLTTNVATNAVMARTPVATIYTQLIADLKSAQSILPADYSISGNARTRANKWIVTALLARIELYNKNWSAAETQSDAIIANTTLFSLSTDLTKVFTPGNTEAIWQFYNDATGYTAYAGTVLPNAVTRIPTYVLTTGLVNAFETGDKRMAAWTASLVYNGTTYYYPYKYKSVTTGANAEYYTIFRLAEMYLIRAEARAEQSNISGAQADLSVIRNRAGLPNTTAGDQASILLAIEQERRIELNNEWGHRWLDLKRTGRANAVIGALKPTWNSTAELFPIPSVEITNNPNLTQNPGY
ncbi:putative outer membrane starch-binding protein [Mucilaginibacter frigoritolerans]|uniref:Putative outer membrane starch-binding protein n=1 Tax=Mucilaginibacter frigoritolerans TaxID=652788 RepID=A0A562UH19_9SPHI|nr:RagB/SusD family nutrient uptake outer membrane protein [Mucilaginibacter frigoritolerans]TWJ04687.1 putative outer membrane starch-binding protein [Mucilaginibacter frigoritolerans]